MSKLPSPPSRSGTRGNRRSFPLLLLEQVENRVLLAPIVVNSTGDGPSTGSVVTLRGAITSANSIPGTTIDFDIPGTAPFVIQPLSPLPALSAPTTIDGTSEPGYAGMPLIELDGTNAGSRANGLQISAVGRRQHDPADLDIANFGTSGRYWDQHCRGVEHGDRGQLHRHRRHRHVGHEKLHMALAFPMETATPSVGRPSRTETSSRAIAAMVSVWAIPSTTPHRTT